MRATAYLVSNQDEIIQAEKLNIKIPEAVIIEAETLFPVTAIIFAFRLGDKIKCITTLGGKDIVIKYEEEVWKRIEAYLIHA